MGTGERRGKTSPRCQKVRHRMVNRDANVELYEIGGRLMGLVPGADVVCPERKHRESETRAKVVRWGMTRDLYLGEITCVPNGSMEQVISNGDQTKQRRPRMARPGHRCRREPIKSCDPDSTVLTALQHPPIIPISGPTVERSPREVLRCLGTYSLATRLHVSPPS